MQRSCKAVHEKQEQQPLRFYEGCSLRNALIGALDEGSQSRFQEALGQKDHPLHVCHVIPPLLVASPLTGQSLDAALNMIISHGSSKPVLFAHGGDSARVLAAWHGAHFTHTRARSTSEPTLWEQADALAINDPNDTCKIHLYKGTNQRDNDADKLGEDIKLGDSAPAEAARAMKLGGDDPLTLLVDELECDAFDTVLGQVIGGPHFMMQQERGSYTYPHADRLARNVLISVVAGEKILMTWPLALLSAGDSNPRDPMVRHLLFIMSFSYIPFAMRTRVQPCHGSSIRVGRCRPHNLGQPLRRVRR
jgi:hypothetical protein